CYAAGAWPTNGVTPRGSGPPRVLRRRGAARPASADAPCAAPRESPRPGRTRLLRADQLPAPGDLRVRARGQVEAARATTAIAQLVDRDLHAARTGVGIPGGSHPAHPLPARHRRDRLPGLREVRG